MIRVTLTPSGLVAKRVLFKCSRFLWALSVFLLRVSFALVCFVIGLGGKQQITSNDRKQNENRNKKQPLKTAPQPSQKQAPQGMVFEPTSFIVTIAPNEAHYREKVQTLRDRGYKWHSGLQAWALPRVRLGNNHPEFDHIISELKLSGYVWNGACWNLYFPTNHNVWSVIYSS